ncbi:unnamed protein product [Meganyctiphanes norvegica]|uniref:C-type lectin domain-containing protein n=1 Tax=Meganyctiphanes norvegica TaxID=48144 RepID=A0AAV2SJI3_MEGNR
MANVMGNMCILFLCMLFTDIRSCEPCDKDGIYDTLGNISDAVNVIMENLITSAKVEKKLYNTLNIIKENSIAMAKLVNNACPDLYERVTKSCIHFPGGHLSEYYPSMGWGTARLYCQAIDGDLPVVDNIPKFMAYYRGKPGVCSHEYRWYGARRIGQEFLYLNGTVLPSNSTLWENGNPGHEDYVAIHVSTQKLVTASSGSLYCFVCKSEL